MTISYVKHNDIDKKQWDKCIAHSVNGIVYAYSWYLDIVAYQWDALVLGDYEAVMPITGKVKYGIHYIFQPKYTQQLGVFTSNLLDEKLVHQFLDAIPRRFKVIDFKFNTFNKVSHPKFKLKQQVTHELDLIGTYKAIHAKFSSNTKRNVKKALKNKVSVSKHVNLKEFLVLLKDNSIDPVSFEHLNILRKVIPFTIKHNLGETYGAYDDKNQLIAAAFFIKSNEKAIYLIAASNDEGKRLSAMFAVVDSFIFNNAERNLTLDFEGSLIEGIARFYKGFGASPINFHRLRRNRLPLLMRFMK